MSKRSREKGKRGEQEVARRLRRIFPEARRGLQSRGGGEEVPDVDVPFLHVEVKRQARPNIYAAIEQAARDCGPDRRPVAYTRRDRGEWLVTMRADDFEELLEGWLLEGGRRTAS